MFVFRELPPPNVLRESFFAGLREMCETGAVMTEGATHARPSPTSLEYATRSPRAMIILRSQVSTVLSLVKAACCRVESYFFVVPWRSVLAHVSLQIWKRLVRDGRDGVATTSLHNAAIARGKHEALTLVFFFLEDAHAVEFHLSKTSSCSFAPAEKGVYQVYSF